MWLRSFLGSPAARARKKDRRRDRRRPPAGRLQLEGLDDRLVPSFVGPTDYPAGGLPTSVVADDFTGDGKLDLAVANYYDGTVNVLVGNGNGTFQPAQPSAAGAVPQSVVAGDLNGDGKADLVAANSAGLSALLATGTGTFRSPQAVAPPGQFPPGYDGTDPLPQSVLSAAVGDLNADGKLDLVVGGQTFFSVLVGSGSYGNYYDYHSDGYVNVLLGNGDGTFAAGQTTHVGSSNDPSTVVLADFTGDGKLDVATDDSGGGYTVKVLPGNGDGTLGGPVASQGSGYGVDLFPGVGATDFNGDGKLDLLARDYSGGLTVLTGAGNGAFAQNPSVYPGAYPQSAAVGDVNADGTIDLAVTWSGTTYGSYGYWGNYDPVTAGHVNVLLGYGDGSFALPQASDLGTRDGFGSFGSSALRDFTGDGAPDLAAADYYNGVVVARNAANWVVPGSLKISDATLTEGDTGTVAVTFTVTLRHGGAQPVTVPFSTSNGSALAGSNYDYQATSGTLTFAPGDTSETVTVLVNGDLTDEPDQLFYVTLSGATGADVADGQGVGTIVDNDPPPTLTINDASVLEGDKGSKVMTFTVTLTGATENYVSVNYATANGTAAVADQDYQAASGAVSFAPGQTTATVSVRITGDKKQEADETLFVNLGGASNAVIVDGLGLGTVRDDDAKGNGNGKGK